MRQSEAQAVSSTSPSSSEASVGRRPEEPLRASERILGWLGACFLRALGATWRLREEGQNPLLRPQGPAIGALYHRDVLVTAWHYRDRGFGVAVSRSRDGDRICAVLRHLGYAAPSRGSSSRGGAAALKQLVRTLQRGTTVSVLTDGPRGPAERSKEGVIALARLSRVPITPLAFAATPSLRFRSWDRTVLPLPFARVVCRYGAPLVVAADASPEDEVRAREELDRRLATLGKAPTE